MQPPHRTSRRPPTGPERRQRLAARDLAHGLARCLVGVLVWGAWGCVGGFPSADPVAPDLGAAPPPGSDLGLGADAAPGAPDRGPPADGGPVRPDARPMPLDRDLDAGPAPARDAAPNPDLGAGRDGAGEPDAAPACAEPERCNGRDEDCDGRIDEGDRPDDPGVCGGYIARSCRVWLGWAVAADGPGGLAQRWGRCPDTDPDLQGNTRCFSTGGDGGFHALLLPANLSRLDEAHHLGLRFDCAADAVGAWVQTHCQAALAVRFSGGDDPDPEDVSPATCGTDATVSPEGLGCVRTGGDGLFHRLRLDRTVRSTTHLAPAFFCADGADPERAASTERSIELFLGLWALDDDDEACPDPGTPHRAWGDCPEHLEDDSGSQRCVGRSGGSGFASVDPLLLVDECDAFALALRPRDPSR